MNDVSMPVDQVPRLPSVRRRAADVTVGDAPVIPVLTQYFRIAYRWKWLIVGSVAITLLVGVLFTLLATPQYTATTRIEISREANRIVNVQNLEPETSAVDQEFYQTQYGLLRSRSLAERVVRQLRLADSEGFFEAFRGSGAFQEISRQAAGGRTAAADRRLQVAIEILLDNVNISPLRTSRLVDIQFTSPDPQLSARIANAWAAGFRDSTLERRYDATSYARTFLEGRLAQLRARLEESERQLVGYASNEGIINIPVGPADASGRQQERSLTADSLAALNGELAKATADRLRAQSRVNRQGGAVAEGLANNTLSALRQTRAEAQAEYSRLSTQFEAGYPPMAALAAQIRQLNRSIEAEESRVQSVIRNAYEDSVGRENALATRVEGLRQSFLDQRRRSIQYNIFQREVDTNRELYDGLLQRYKEIGIAGGVGTNNVSIVDQARPPERPSKPAPLINLILALLGGIAIGIVLALIREQIDESVLDPTDVEERVGLPLLGAVPMSKTEDRHAELKDPKSSLIEAYLSVQNSLAFSTDHGIPKTIAITSTRPAEGKSLTAYAIAYAIARTGAKTLLVDGDMRSPSVHHDLGLNNAKGLSNYLSGTDNLDTLTQNPEGEPFTVLTAGPQPPNAAELLRSGRLDALFAELANKFDHVVIDSPPVMGLADAPIIASKTEGVVFVVEARGVKARLARLAIGRLRQARTQLLGAVLTKFEARQAHFGYGYDYGYGYGSGDAKSA